MRKIILMLMVMVMATFLLASSSNVNATPEFVKKGIKIIDIRTQEEWIQTGIVKNAIPITFFDARGGYDAAKFLETLNTHVKKNEEFALICRTGNRTTAVSDFLGKNGYNVINLKGGVVSLMQQGYKLSRYNP